LLNIAHDSPPEQGMAIIRELLQMETLPPAIKIRAVILQSRYALPGRLVSELAPGLALTPGRETWLYTWSENNPGNLVLAKMLAGDKPPDVELVGLCLGGETAALTQINTGGERPPGRLVRDDGVMSAHLLMSEAGLAYRVDADGVIRSVSLVRDMRDMRDMQSQRANANARRERSAP
jgi:hypothetical protein